MNITMDGNYETRDNREVRIYAVEDYNDNSWAVHGAIKQPSGRWEIKNWYLCGRSTYIRKIGQPSDLIEVKPRIKRTVYIHVFENAVRAAFNTCPLTPNNLQGANLAIVRVEIDCNEGDGINESN